MIGKDFGKLNVDAVWKQRMIFQQWAIGADLLLIQFLL